MADENEVKALADRFYDAAVSNAGSPSISVWETAQHAAREALRWRDETRPLQSPPAAAVSADAWIKLYRRAMDVAGGLTNYIEDRPELSDAERKLDAIEREARAMLAAAPAQQPAAAVPGGWRVMWFTGTVTRDSERWEVYDPDGNGGAVDKGDVRDDMVRGLLDALAAAERKGECPHAARCDCLGGCKRGMRGNGAVEVKP